MTDPVTPSAKPTSKAAFVRSLAVTIPVAEVVAKAKAAGLDLTKHYVHKTRHEMKVAAKKSPKKVATPSATPAKAANKPAKRRGRPKKTAASPAPKAAAPAFGSKRAFIESMPDAKAKEVVAAAKKAGIKLSEPYVYIVRGGSKKKPNKSRNKPGPKPKAAAITAPIASATKATGGSGSVEARVRDLVLEAGVGRIQALVEQMRRKLESISLS